jgi:hypothetical protein
MLTELHGKGGALCQLARQGTLHCPLIVRRTSEDVITGNIVQTLRVLNPRWWLPDFLNAALGVDRFPRQIFRKLRIEPWVNQPPYPRELLPWDEGSTQVDCEITWENQPTTVFIEAKFQAGLSRTTANSGTQDAFPADQLIRNVRVGLHKCGYFERNALFQTKPRDFVTILLSPMEGHPLVEEYRDPSKLLAAIPSSERLIGLPGTPFVGALSFAQLQAILRKQCRWFSRPERVLAEALIDYLASKRPRLGEGISET